MFGRRQECGCHGGSSVDGAVGRVLGYPPTRQTSRGSSSVGHRQATEAYAISQRRGTLHSYTLFTGYYQQRMRGEMRSFQVLGDR